MIRRRLGRGALLCLVAVVAYAVTDLAASAAWEWGRDRLDPARRCEKSIRVRSDRFHHTFAPSRRCDGLRWGPLRYTLVTDSLGLRSDATRTVAPSAARARILFIGDSFTEGIGISYADTFVGRLAARLDAEVLNAAVGSYSPTIYLKKIEYLLDTVGLRIDEVVVLLDLSDIEDEMEYAIEPGGRVTKRGETETQPGGAPAIRGFLGRHMLVTRAVYKAATEWRTIMRTPSSADAAAARVLNPRGRWTIDPQRYAVVGEEGLRRAEGRMTELRDLLRANGVGLSLVVYPWPAQIAGRDLDSLQVRFWKAWSARHGVRFLDLFPVFVDGRDPGRVLDELFIDEDVHWNARGHAKVADALAPWLAAVRR